VEIAELNSCKIYTLQKRIKIHAWIRSIWFC